MGEKVEYVVKIADTKEIADKLEAAGKTIETVKAEAAKKDEQIKELNTKLDAANKEISDLKAELVKRDETLAEKDRAISEKDKAIATEAAKALAAKRTAELEKISSEGIPAEFAEKLGTMSDAEFKAAKLERENTALKADKEKLTAAIREGKLPEDMARIDAGTDTAGVADADNPNSYIDIR